MPLYIGYGLDPTLLEDRDHPLYPSKRRKEESQNNFESKDTITITTAKYEALYFNSPLLCPCSPRLLGKILSFLNYTGVLANIRCSDRTANSQKAATWEHACPTAQMRDRWSTLADRFVALLNVI